MGTIIKERQHFTFTQNYTTLINHNLLERLKELASLN